VGVFKKINPASTLAKTRYTRETVISTGRRHGSPEKKTKIKKKKKKKKKKKTIVFPEKYNRELRRSAPGMVKSRAVKI